ncbi:MAG: exopolyphosphatase / guanosine-5-triphosphate,3-diphosphate pyrophosphatase [Actinomycetota bacterium]|jgi:exopolyphosphatase/guanosine-5'-triphosphate,3'-diphosphate pyrophosphatase|nr:exopolyphosphatase / guanosine-5-triphosphate,3-diphosphate pyrophosphatase [Actinomycetota bacterium]
MSLRLAAVDLGSNSFHLVVVEAHPDGTFDTLLREKEMLYLGDVVTRTGRIPPGHVERVLETLRRFSTMAGSVGALEIRACATSALREAENSAEVVDAIAAETGIEVEVISGRREAELIFSAVKASVDLGPGTALCLDLGGGSLEVMVGDHDGLRWSSSLHLGGARLAAQHVRSDPPSASDERRLRDAVVAGLEPIVDDVRSFGPMRMVGTSGTFLDLARLADVDGTGMASRRELDKVHEGLLAAPMVAGSVVLRVAMDLFGFDTMVVGEWALREGMVLDAIRRRGVAEWTGDAKAIRRSSVTALARRCGWDEGHATQVARLAVDLFDGTAPLHGLSSYDRELLEHGALLHDIGEHVAIDGHHKHTAYLIEHGKLRGFTPADVDLLCVLGRCHRRSDPKPSFEPFARLRPDRREAAVALLALLRIADGLDRGHSAAVRSVEVEVGEGSVRLVVAGDGDLDVEVWGVRRKRELFERVFERRLDLVDADHPSVATRPSGS